MTTEQFRSLLAALHRIADAFEAQNRAYAEEKAKDEAIIQQRRDELMALEREKLEIERHILDLHKLNVNREQTWRKEQKTALEKQTRDIVEQNTRTYEQWLTIMQEERDKIRVQPGITRWGETIGK